MKPLENSILIIGGQPKAGTSSLFHWLSQHPDIEPSCIKEARFFLDKDYPLPSSTRYNGYNEHEYLQFFNDLSLSKTLLDASPDYLYSKNALSIPAVLPNSRIVFIVRDPVERMVSWYKFAAEIGRLDKGMTFDAYIEYQLTHDVTEKTPTHFRALDQNRVGRYLPLFQERFGSRCLLEDFAALKKDPKSTVQRICRFAALDPKFCDTFDFTPQNISTGMRVSKSSRVYYRTRAAFNYLVKPSPRVSEIIRPLNLGIKKIFLRPKKLEEIQVTAALADQIRRFSQ